MSEQDKMTEQETEVTTSGEAPQEKKKQEVPTRSMILMILAGCYLVYTGYRLCKNVLDGVEGGSWGFFAAGAYTAFRDIATFPCRFLSKFFPGNFSGSPPPPLLGKLFFALRTVSFRQKTGKPDGFPVSACRKSLFSPLSKFSELHKSSENLGF